MAAMTRRHRGRAGVGAVALAAGVALSACGGGSEAATGVASLNGSGNESTTTTAPAQKADAQQAMLDFAKCMREHGIDMPDPTFDADGRGTMTVGGTSSGGAPDKAKMDAAQKACQSFMDKASVNMPKPDPAQIEQEKQKMLDFAKCMRDHGVDFPDPTFNSDGGGLQVQMGGPGIDPESPAFKSANDACSSQVGMPKIGTAQPAATP